LTITHEDLAQLMSALAPFNRDGWIFELKYDGSRMRGGRAELVSRRAHAQHFDRTSRAWIPLAYGCSTCSSSTARTCARDRC
jgi:hypothetical protein